ncbi:hypothetical protein [uncultured Desulfuromonas sp.]|uniref:3-hydroxyacyl-ACP dehydratase FabZ family protein n=1 Tax=uncultured Desulfuromonas sp. TaxID=181013 RepID=UPI00261C2364|nr:hypothetical protein [uncultured Desulfuromonas sp.]
MTRQTKRDTGIRQAIREAALGPAHSGEDETTGRYRFEADFPGFDGHFPGYPVLPAVVQMLTAALLAEEFAGVPLRLARVERARFLVQLRPGQEITVSCRRRGSDAPVFDAALEADGEEAASFRMVFAAGDEE